jgi:hypothetical protein
LLTGNDGDADYAVVVVDYYCDIKRCNMEKITETYYNLIKIKFYVNIVKVDIKIFK